MYHNHLNGLLKQIVGGTWPISRKRHYWSIRISNIAECVLAWFESTFQTSIGDSDAVILSLTLWEPRGQVTGTMRSPCLTSYLQEGGNFEERHTRTLERLNLSLATSVTFQDARYLMPVSILDENWQPFFPCASSFTHLHFTRKYVSQYYSRQGTVLNQEWSPFFNNNFLVRMIWTATLRIPCTGLNECDLVFKYFVFQTKYGRLQTEKNQWRLFLWDRKPGRLRADYVPRHNLLP